MHKATETHEVSESERKWENLSTEIDNRKSGYKHTDYVDRHDI